MPNKSNKQLDSKASKASKVPAQLAWAYDTLVVRINEVTLDWIAFHLTLHPTGQVVAWSDPANTDYQTSLEWTGQLINTHADNNRSCRDAIKQKYGLNVTFMSEPNHLNTTDAGYYAAISNWVECHKRLFLCTWALYFGDAVPKIQSYSLPSSLHAAVYWLALNCQPFVDPENAAAYHENPIELRAIPGRPNPSEDSPTQSLENIEYGCHRLACYLSDIASEISQLLVGSVEQSNKRGKPRIFSIK